MFDWNEILNWWLPGCMFSDKDDWMIDGGTDSDHINDISDGALYIDSVESSTDNWISSDVDSKANNQKRLKGRDSHRERRLRDNVKRNRDSRRESFKTRSKDVPSHDESSLRQRLHGDVSPDKERIFQMRAISDIKRYEGLSRTQSDPRLRDLCREETHKRSNSSKNSSISRIDSDRCYYSSSSSVVSEKRSEGLSDYSSSKPNSSQRHHPSNTSSYQGSEGQVRINHSLS